MNAFLPADILMPKTDHMEKWAVIACDQFTSDQAYWDRVRKNAEGAVSTINLILPEAELLLFSAARVQHVRKVILPVLKRGGIVLCDRFIDSTTAYQGYARGLDLNVIDDMNAFAVCGRFPDLTIVLDLSVEDGIRRLSGRYQGQQVDDRFESAGHTFHSCVREGFLDIARKHPGRVRVVDANRPVELVQADLWWEIYHALN